MFGTRLTSWFTDWLPPAKMNSPSVSLLVMREQRSADPPAPHHTFYILSRLRPSLAGIILGIRNSFSEFGISPAPLGLSPRLFLGTFYWPQGPIFNGLKPTPVPSGGASGNLHSIPALCPARAMACRMLLMRHTTSRSGRLVDDGPFRSPGSEPSMCR
jgi:hypothetical protein